MKNKLPIQYKENLFSKVKCFFNNVFKKNFNTMKQLEVIKENKDEININVSDLDKMKVASKKVSIKEEILTLVEKNPTLIENLTIEKLKELDKMYDEIIEKNDRKIKQLKRRNC